MGIGSINAAHSRAPEVRTILAPDTDFVCYDVETTGRNARFDSITQFAMVRLDRDLVETDSLSIRVALPPYAVPHPEALAVTGVSPEDLDAADRVDEYDAAGMISSALAPRPREFGWGANDRVYCGYNVIGYDDEVLRRTLFRNLRAPYFAADRSGRYARAMPRLDVLHLVRLASLLPGTVEQVVNPDGTRSFDLARLAAANGVEFRAHEALSDARATVDIARLVRDRAPWAWETALTCGTKKGGNDAILRSPPGEPVWYVRRDGIRPCLRVPTGGNGWEHLLVSTGPGLDRARADGDVDRESLYRDGCAFEFKANKGHYVVPTRVAEMLMTGEEMDLARERMGELSRSPWLGRLREAWGVPRSFDAGPDSSENQLYRTMPSDRDERECAAFHAATSWEDRARMTFSDPRVADFAARIVRRNLDDPGIVACVGEDGLSRLNALCAEAYARPAGAEDAGYNSLAGVMAADCVTPGFEDWIRNRFGYEATAPLRP